MTFQQKSKLLIIGHYCDVNYETCDRIAENRFLTYCCELDVIDYAGIGKQGSGLHNN